MTEPKTWEVNHCVQVQTDSGVKYAHVQVQAGRGYYTFPVPLEDGPKYKAGQRVSITVKIEEDV